MKKVLFLLFSLIALAIALCSCDDECKHSWKLPTCDTPRICDKCGTTEGEPLSHKWQESTCLSAKKCKACGLTEGEALGHSWSTLDCTAPKKCVTCGVVGERTQHIWNTKDCLAIPNCTVCKHNGEQIPHNWQEATCEAARICQSCGQISGDALGHNWQITTCQSPKQCSECQKTSYEGLPHKWIFRGCDKQRICSVCSRGEGHEYGHTWIDATCTKLKHCDKCNLEEGEIAGHKWKEATCITPKTCTTCKLTEGSSIGHSYTLTYSTKALCEIGRDVYTCSTCNKVTVFEEKAKYGYHLCDEYGVCLQCKKHFNTDTLVLEAIEIQSTYDVKKCGIFTSEEASVKIYKPITYSDIGMPIIDLGGELPTYKGPVNNVAFTYSSEDLSFNCYAEIKVQGASSSGYPKKNFNIKLIDEGGNKTKIKIVDQWGKESKYCLKANYIDYSQSRNVVSGQIFGEIVKSRNDELMNTPNGGAIDGFPILVYNNGVYQGLYTFNIPKDNWMFDMSHSDEKNQAIFMTTTWNNAVSFREISTNGFELEYASNEESQIDNDTRWAYDSMLDLIRFVYNNDGEDFKNGIHQYADIDKCIDSMIYTFFICADDNTSKNILWVTLDGKVWFSSMYDMDGTWGMRWNGNIEFDASIHPISALKDGEGLAPERNPSNYNLLWQRIYMNFFDRVCERYKELRREILTMSNITMHFDAFFNSIPDIIRETEQKKWTGVPTQNIDHLEQILLFTRDRLALFDSILIT